MQNSQVCECGRKGFETKTKIKDVYYLAASCFQRNFSSSNFPYLRKLNATRDRLESEEGLTGTISNFPSSGERRGGDFILYRERMEKMLLIITSNSRILPIALCFFQSPPLRKQSDDFRASLDHSDNFLTPLLPLPLTLVLVL